MVCLFEVSTGMVVVGDCAGGWLGLLSSYNKPMVFQDSQQKVELAWCSVDIEENIVLNLRERKRSPIRFSYLDNIDLS